MFFFAWNLGPLKCWCFRCFHGIDIPNLLPSTTLSQVRGELKSEAANLWVPGFAAFGATRFPWRPSGFSAPAVPVAAISRVGDTSHSIGPMHFLGRPKETDFKLLEEQRKLQCQLEVEKLGGGTSPFFSQLCRADKKNRTLFFCSDLRKELLRKREHELRQMEMHLGVDGIRAPGIRCSRWFKVHHATAFIFPWQF